MYLNIEYKYLNSFSIFNQNYFLCNASARIKQYCRMVHEMAPRNESVFVKQLQSVCVKQRHSGRERQRGDLGRHRTAKPE